MSVDIRAHRPIDCDIHPAVPNFDVVLPYLDDYWRETAIVRGIDRTDFELTAYPANSPLSCRPDWRPVDGNPGTDLGLLRSDALDEFGSRIWALFKEEAARCQCG